MSTAAGPFVGRVRELEQLVGLLDAARSGRGALVEISGEAGIGKTRLVEEVADRAAASGWRVVWGVASNLAGAPPYLPWIEILEALDTTRSIPPPAGRSIEALLPRASAEPRIEDLPATPWELADRLRSRLAESSRQQPLLLVLDDAQWFDAASHRLLGGLARDIEYLQLLVLVCHRTGEPAIVDALADAFMEASRAGVLSHTSLSGLETSEVAVYVTDTLGVPKAATLAAALRERTGGNPYFLRELTAQLSEAPDAARAEAGLPEGIRGALSRRLSAFGPTPRERLVFAALLGREFSLDEWALAANAPREALLADADALLLAHVIVETAAGEYRFVHDLMREAALDGVSETRRAEFHGFVARRLEDAPDLRGNTGLLAWHFREGARLDLSLAPRALAYSREAGEQAYRAGAWERADAHLTDALDLMLADGTERPKRAQLLLMRGSARRATGDGRAAFRDLMTAASEFRGSGDWDGQARAAIEASRLWAPTERKLATLDEALTASGSRDPQLEAQLVARRARIAVADPDATIARAMDLAGSPPSLPVQAELTALRGRTAFLARDFATAAPLLREAFALFDALGQASDAVAMLTDEQDCYLMGGDYPRAQDHFETVIRYARRTGQRVEEHVWLGDSGAFATLAGDLDLARRRAAEASAAVAYPAFAARVAIAEFTGETAGLSAKMPEVESVGGVVNLAVHVLGLRARARWLEGDLVGARAELEACARLPFDTVEISHATGNGQGPLEALASESLVRHWYEAFERAPEVRAVIWASADRMRGTLALRLGLVDAAEEHLRCGLEWCEANSVHVEAARCLADLAEVAVRRGHTLEAESLLTQAHGRFEEFGAVGYARRTAEHLEGLRLAPPTTLARPAGLSPREVEVLRLVASGMTNREIAELLVVSPHTVANHVKHILNKTGLSNRTEATAFAIRSGLTPPVAT